MAGCAVKKTHLIDQQTELDCHSLQSVVLGDFRAPMEELLAKIEWSYPDDWQALDHVESQIPSNASADQLFLLAQIKIIRANHPKTPFWKKPGMVKQGLQDLNQVIQKFPNNQLYRLKRLEFHIFLPNPLQELKVIQEDLWFLSQSDSNDLICTSLTRQLAYFWNYGSPPQEEDVFEIPIEDAKRSRYLAYKRRQYQELWSNR